MNAPETTKTTYVLIGMPGVGKSTLGRKLAAKLALPYADSDVEIEAAAGMSVASIFERFGEPHFREGERRVIARLIEEGPKVLSTGGGAFLNEQTRALIKEKTVSIWLEGDLDLLVSRCLRSGDRPLLKKGDPREILESLLRARTAFYEQAALKVHIQDASGEANLQTLLAALERHARQNPPKKEP